MSWGKGGVQGRVADVQGEARTGEAGGGVRWDEPARRVVPRLHPTPRAPDCSSCWLNSNTRLSCSYWRETGVSPGGRLILDPPRERSFKGPGFSPQHPPGAFVLSGGLQRIRYAHERTPGIWLWNVTVKIPGSPRTSRPGVLAVGKPALWKW